MTSNYGCQEDQLSRLIAKKITHSITIDGNLTKEVWSKSMKASLVDMVTGEPAFLETKASALWDEQYLYVGFWLSEPNIQAELTERDSLIFTENDIEVFIAGKDCYYEFQINALGTCYEVFYIWQDAYKKDSRFDTPEFDLLEREVDVLGGFQDEIRFKKHPRGRRWAFMDWDFPGLKSAVKIQGTINDSTNRDDGWTVELAFPWKGMNSLFGKEVIPRKNLTELRINFSRFQKLQYNNYYPKKHPGWALNSHGVYDSHIPNCFSYLAISQEEIEK